MIRLFLAAALSFAASASAANFNVTNGNDSGAGSLRQALADAAASAGGDTIAITTTLPVTLAGTALDVNSEVEIIGNHSTVDAAGLSTVFQVTSSGAGCVEFRGLRVTGGSGSGISVSSSACVVVLDCAITGNRGSSGGGIIASGANLSVVNSSVDNNDATTGTGGALNASSSTVTLLNATLAQNTAKVSGGGAFFMLNSIATITNCTITDNLADSDDDGVGDGGGIGVVSGSTLTITNTAVTGNQDSPGNDGSGAIQPNFTASVGSITTQGQNFIGRNDSVAGTFPAGTPNANGDYVGTAASPISADLTALQGRRLYYTFGQNSLLRDNGDNSANGEAVDQRGYPRFIGAAIDIGAIEMAYLVVTNTNDTGAGSLRSAISTANGQGYGDIVFDFPGPASPHVIVLTSGQLSISASQTILGPSAANRQVTISADGDSRVMSMSGLGVVEVALRDVDLALGNTASHAALDQRGGGLLIASANVYAYLDSVTISDCTVADLGGGIYLSGGRLSARDTTVTRCESTTSGGGGIYNSGNLTLERVTLDDNDADTTGGGLQNLGMATLTNCTISGNNALLGEGGGIYSNASSVANGVTLSHCTITSNTADSGGGIAETAIGYFRVRNTIIAGNTGNSGPGVDLAGAFTSLGHNLVGNDTGGTGFTHGVGGNIVGTGASPINALLGPLADNGGETLTHALLPGSPAVEAGDTAASSFIDLDQTLHPRLHNTNVDIGAVEYIRQFTSAETIDPTASEVHAPLPLQPGLVRIHRDSTAGDLPVPLTLGSVGASASFTDFLLFVIGPGSVSQTAGSATATIAAGQTSIDLSIIPFDDILYEGVENLILLPTTDVYGQVDTTAPAPAEVDIGDNEYRVTDYSDGPGPTLRNTIGFINAIGTGGTILFNNELGTPHAEVITLGSPLNITSVVEIIGPTTTRASVTVSGGGTTRVFNVSPGAHATFRNLTIANGFAAGGAGLNMSGTIGVVENCLFVANHSTGNGGGIDSTSGTLTVTNSTFTDNRANLNGGAVSTAAGVTVTLQNCTVVGNTADDDNNATGAGGGLAGMGGNLNELRIRNTLVAANATSSGTGPDIFNAVTTLGTNLVSDNTDSSVLFPAGSPNANNDYVGTGAAPIDARVGPLRENGGGTMTRGLLFGSPAVEHGNNSGAPATDQRGLGRQFGSFVDIGAYELRPESYAYWSAHEFGSAPNSASGDDFDLDGVANGVEHAMGSDPTDGGSLPYLAVEITGDQFDVFVSRSPLASIGTQRVSTSPDCLTWTPAPLANYSSLGTAPGEVNGELIRMRLIMAPGTLKMFARVELIPDLAPAARQF